MGGSEGSEVKLKGQLVMLSTEKLGKNSSNTPVKSKKLDQDPYSAATLVQSSSKANGLESLVCNASSIYSQGNATTIK
jgi:hypothetical protein